MSSYPGLHIGIVLTLFAGITPRRYISLASPIDRPDTLRIRFIELATHVSLITAPPVKRRHAPVISPAAAHGRAVVMSPHPVTMIDPMPVAVATPVPSYIPGGTLLQGTAMDRRSASLPGSGVAIVRGIRLVDPRTRGVAGAVRKLQALLGVLDRHCVDVDAWRTWSTQELLGRHISPEQVQRTAEQYKCFPRNA